MRPATIITVVIAAMMYVQLAFAWLPQPALAIPYGGCAYGAPSAEGCGDSGTSTKTSQPPGKQGFFEKLDKYERIIFGGLAALAASQFFIIFFRGNQKKEDQQPTTPIQR